MTRPGYENVASRDRETAPPIGLGVHATYMQRVVLVPRIPDPTRPLWFGRVRGHNGDRVWVQWIDRDEHGHLRHGLVSSVRAQFLAPACALCMARFTREDEVHHHEVDGYPRRFTPVGLVPDMRIPHPIASNDGPSSILGAGGPGALLGITTPHDGPSTLTIRNPTINQQTAGWPEDPYRAEREALAHRLHRRALGYR